MKSSKITFIAVAAVVALLVVYLFTFQVRRNEVAVHYRRGAIYRIVNMDKNEAGWKFRFTRPFDKVVKYDKGVRVLETPAVQTQLQDQRQVIVGMSAELSPHRCHSAGFPQIRSRAALLFRSRTGKRRRPALR